MSNLSIVLTVHMGRKFLNEQIVLQFVNDNVVCYKLLQDQKATNIWTVNKEQLYKLSNKQQWQSEDLTINNKAKTFFSVIMNSFIDNDQYSHIEKLADELIIRLSKPLPQLGISNKTVLPIIGIQMLIKALIVDWLSEGDIIWFAPFNFGVQNIDYYPKTSKFQYKVQKDSFDKELLPLCVKYHQDDEWIVITNPIPRWNLEQFTVAILKDLARQYGLTGWSKLKKADLIHFLRKNGVK